MRNTLILFIIVAMFGLVACSKGNGNDEKMSEAELKAIEAEMNTGTPTPAGKKVAAGGQDALPPDGQLGIAPMSPTALSRLELSAPGGLDLSEAMVHWFLNGAPLSGFSSSSLDLAEAEIRKGDSLYAKVDIQGTELRSPEVTVKNTPPNIVSLRIMPETFKPGDRIYVDVKVEDADGDPVELTYEWTVNGNAAGSDSELGSGINRGDQFDCLVTPYDGEEYGQDETIKNILGNQPPMIQEHYDYTFDGTTYSYQTKASDPDGDPMTFALKSGPDGMEIDSSNGAVTWQVPSDFVGTANYVISADDGQGGSSEMEQSFRITVEK